MGETRECGFVRGGPGDGLAKSVDLCLIVIFNSAHCATRSFQQFLGILFFFVGDCAGHFAFLISKIESLKESRVVRSEQATAHSRDKSLMILRLLGFVMLLTVATPLRTSWERALPSTNVSLDRLKASSAQNLTY